MAGTSPDFNSGVFRSAIKATMQMGQPADDAHKLVWHFNDMKTYSVADPALKPYDWTETPATDTPDPAAVTGSVIVDYALEFAAQTTPENTNIGTFDTSHVVVTLLDVDYEKVKNADYAMIGGVRYDIDFTGPPIGLFDVTTFQIYLTSRDEARP